MATREQVAACFSSGNMPAASVALRAKYPAKEMIVCADADDAGRKAAEATGLKYLRSKFSDVGVDRFRRLSGNPDARPSDFNDYANVYSFEDLKKCLMKI
jgi:phage/plasmid primase-like uncharacterized protein